METREEIFESIAKEIDENRIVLYMKGDKLMPLCGFSGRVVHILNELGVEFLTCDVIENPELRQAIKEFSNWPTLPQLYVDGQFIGGCDIVTQMHETGELKSLVCGGSHDA